MNDNIKAVAMLKWANITFKNLSVTEYRNGFFTNLQDTANYFVNQFTDKVLTLSCRVLLVNNKLSEPLI